MAKTTAPLFGFGATGSLAKSIVFASWRGVGYARGSNYHVAGKDVPALRLAFGYPSPEEIQLGVRRLAECIHDTVAAHANRRE